MAGSSLSVAPRNARSKILRILKKSANKITRKHGPAATDAAQLFVLTTAGDIDTITGSGDCNANTVGDICLWRDTNTANTWHLLVATWDAGAVAAVWTDVSGAVTLPLS